MDKDQRSARRRQLHQIYLDHDVAAFREFLRETGVTFDPSAPDEELSDLMHNMKSQLIYLGDVWQESRNHMRYQTMWQKAGRPRDQIPLCVTCKYFRDAPAVSGEESPCMLLGATPADLACPAHQPIE